MIFDKNNIIWVILYFIFVFIQANKWFDLIWFWFDSLLLFDKHISEKVNKAYTMLGIIKRNFTHISRTCFVILYKSLVRSHLEYANSVWYPKRKVDVDKLERVQKRATKLIPELSKKSYSDRLKSLNLPIDGIAKIW